MGIPGLGHKSYMQIKKEATYGTNIVATKKMEIISADISPVIGTIDDPSLYAGASRRGLYQGGILYRGTIAVRLNYEGLLQLFQGVFGGGATTGPVETSVFTHTFKEALTLPSYTIELVEGDITTTLCQDLVGVKFLSMTVKGKAGQGADGMLTAEFEIIAQDKVVGQTPASLTFPPLLPVLFHQGVTASLLEGSGDATTLIRIRDFEVTLTNNLTEDRFYLGNQNIDEPIRGDFLDASIKFTQEFQTISLFTKARAFTAATSGVPVKLVFQHPTVIAGASTLKREIEFHMNSANIVEYGNPISSYGVILSTVRWRGWQDATDVSALVCRVQNSETAIPA